MFRTAALVAFATVVAPPAVAVLAGAAHDILMIPLALLIPF